MSNVVCIAKAGNSENRISSAAQVVNSDAGGHDSEARVVSGDDVALCSLVSQARKLAHSRAGVYQVVSCIL